MDLGIKNAAAHVIVNPLPLSWLGRADMPPALPAYASIAKLSATQLRNLLAQIGYTESSWNYSMIGTNNSLGRYQFSPALLESYGLLAQGSNTYYGNECVNYTTCWRSVTIRKNTNGYANYIYNDQSLNGFLNNKIAQEHLAYQVVYDLYNGLALINGITNADSAEVIAGMINVAWNLGVGQAPAYESSSGTGAYAWRYSNIGAGQTPYNTGRYTVTVLSQ